MGQSDSLMPTYIFKNNKTGKEHEEFMKMSEVDDYKKENNCSIVMGTPNLNKSSTRDIYAKSDDDFKSRMKNIKKKYPTKQMQDW